MTMNGMNISSPTLPPGFRFHPTDQELIIHYLKNKASSSPNPAVSIIADVNIYKFNPWDLPGKAMFGDSEWFFFSPRDRKYPNGARPNRTAASGYWKATGTDKPILTSSGKQCLGVKKALVFYKGRPPKGVKTNWMMLEYRLLDDTSQSQRLRGSMRLDDWVLCRVRQKSKTPVQVGENYNSNCSIFPSFTPGYLQGQEITKKNNILEDSNYEFQAYLMAPPESEEADEQGLIEFQEGSPDYSVSAVDSNPQTPTVSSIKEALESIKKVLSIGALDELVPLQPKKRLKASTSKFEDNESIFQVSSPTTTASAASYTRCFSEFIF